MNPASVLKARHFELPHPQQLLFERACRYLSRIEIPFKVLEKHRTLDFRVEDQGHAWTCILSLFHESGLVFYSCSPINVPAELRSRMALLLTLINNECIFGNFELDLKTGDLRFKTYADCTLEQFSENILERMLLKNLKTWQKYQGQLLEILKKA